MIEHIKTCILCLNSKPCKKALVIIDRYSVYELVDAVGGNWSQLQARAISSTGRAADSNSVG